MATFIFFIFSLYFFFSFTSTFLYSEAKTTKCRCSNGGPDIQFPFHIKGQNQSQTPQNESVFEVVCRGGRDDGNNNSTVIHFPSYGDLMVKSISYNTQRLDLVDPRSCVHEVFLNLDLSQTPFSYYYLLKNYTYLSCTDKLSPVFTEVPCLSGSGHFVYTVEPSMAAPDFCKAIKTVAIPFGYSPYLSDSSFGLKLTWGFLDRQDFDREGFSFRVGHVHALSIGIFVLSIAAVAAVLLLLFTSRKIYYSKKLGNHQVEVEKFLGDDKAFSTLNDDEAYVEQVNNQF